MIAELVNSGLDPRGRRYTAQERDAAYQYWRLAAGRSCSKVEQQLGIDRNTVMAWRDADGWIARADAEDHEDIAANRQGLGALVATQLVKNIETVIEIRDDKEQPGKVRLDASAYLNGLMGVVPVTKIEQSVIREPKQADIIDVPSLVGLSPEELMRRETEARSKR
jgi:hypothetical protein